MMIKNMKRAIVLGLTALVLFVAAPAPKALAADNAPVHTAVSISGKINKQVVTYRVNLDKRTVTDGRIAVTYDKDILTLIDDNEDRFDEKDVNYNYVSGDKEGLSIAFVNDSPKTLSGRTVTLTFEVKPEITNTDTVITTQVLELNNEETGILTDVVLEDSLNIGRLLPKTPTGLTLGQTLVAFIPKWKADANADGYVVYRSESKDGDYIERGTTSTTFFYDANVKNNTTYYYKVTSYQMNNGKRVESEATKPISGTIKKFFGWFG